MADMTKTEKNIDIFGWDTEAQPQFNFHGRCDHNIISAGRNIF